MAAETVKRSFKYVYIPVDMSEPIQEREITYGPDKEVECLLDAIKDHFRATVPKKNAAQIAAQRADLISKLPAGTELNENLLNMATNLQMVETISLLSNSKDFGFVGVNLYVDDEGAVRGSPRNVRATEIAHCCGHPIDVKGDAFLARVMDDGDNFERLDFSLNEMSSSAEWVKHAQAQAVKRRNAESSAEVLRRMQQDSAAAATTSAQVRELTPAEAAKEEGNAAFKRQNWEEAAGHYSKALELDPLMLPALNNRAMALLKMQKWQEALIDCTSVLEKQPSNVKALLRAAAAEVELGMKEEAKGHLEAALSAEPSNKEAQKKLDELMSSGGTDAAAS